MTITVAIISKNREKLLHRCLISLSLQDKVPDKIILVEDISQNKFFDKKSVSKYFPDCTAINYFETRTQNYAVARNICLNSLDRDLLVFVDDDILLPRNYLSSTERLHRLNKDIFAYVGRILPVNMSKITKYQSVLFMGEYRFLKKDKIIPTYPLTVTSLKSKILKKYNYKFDENFYVGEDHDFLLKHTTSGEKLIFTPSLKAFHFFKKSLLRLCLRHYEYGQALPKLIKKYPKFFYNPYRKINIFSLKELFRISSDDLHKMKLDQGYFFLSLLHHLSIFLGA
ncbi:MAG: glycosyltransferase, partial [Candidatus Pacebacteria bacterium]|nr:glycosyltransferase [Candidatus Paceibacterota bacterium]